jgi:outer membrane protein assembly factor BamB
MISTLAVTHAGSLLVGSEDGTLYNIHPEKGSFSKVVIWTAVTGGPIYSSPVQSPDGTVYVGSNDGKLYAIGAAGITLWTYATAGAVESSPAIGPNGTVYVGSQDGRLYAIDSNGSLEWDFDTGAPVFSSPAVGPNGVIYVGSENGNVYALLANGSLLWSYHAGAAVYSSPAVAANGTVYVGSNDLDLYAFGSNGSLEWKFATGGSVFSSPAIDAQGTVFIGSGDNHLYAVYPNGSLQWSVKTEGKVQSSPTIGIHQTILFTAPGRGLYAIGADTFEFDEKGLPHGFTWNLSFGSTNLTSNKSVLSIRPTSGGVGGYAWSVPTLWSCGGRCEFVPAPSSGHVTAQSFSAIHIVFTEQFRIIITIEPRGSGSTNPRQNTPIWVNGEISIAAHPYTLYVFKDWSSDASGFSFSNSSASQTTVQIDGPGTIVAHLTKIVGSPIGVGSHLPHLPLNQPASTPHGPPRVATVSVSSTRSRNEAS